VAAQGRHADLPGRQQDRRPRTQQAALADFARYGIKTVLGVSSSHKTGLDTLLAQSLATLPKDGDTQILDEDPERVRIAFVGRPNVGKSTLVNRILGEERMIASDVPGTTRDSIAVDLERDGRKYRLIDTAGLRRRGRVEEAVEKFSIVKTLQAIEHCQVAVIMLDASEGVTEQDASVLGAVLDAGRALGRRGQQVGPPDRLPAPADRSAARAQALVRRWAEAVRISALHGSGLRELFKAIHRAHASATHKFSTAEITKALEIAYETNPPPVVRGHVAKLRFAHPGGENPPTFIVHGTRLRTLSDSYRRISKTSSASASSSSARRCGSSSRKATTRTRTSRRTR
jgi:GTP-binding protein